MDQTPTLKARTPAHQGQDQPMLEFHRNERARQLRPSLSRSWLLVRPNSAEKDFEEAFASEADSIILDLEDGCPEDEKDEARLFYVAATRATHRLVITASGDGGFGRRLG